MPDRVDERVGRSTELLQLIGELQNPGFDVEAEKQSVIDACMRIYKASEDYQFRHQYSEISRYIYNQELDPDACVTICEGLDSVLEDIEDSNVRRAVEKLIDHITLESLRIGQMQDAINQAKTLEELVQKAEESVNNIVATNRDIQTLQGKMEGLAEKEKKTAEQQEKIANDLETSKGELKVLEDSVRKHNIESIAILSIFAGVVFAFSGGFTMLGNVFTNIAQIRSERALFFVGCISLVGTLLFDVIYMLLAFADRLASGRKHMPRVLLWFVNIIGILLTLVALGGYFNLLPMWTHLNRSMI